MGGDGVGHQLGDVLVAEAVVDVVALAPSADEASKAQLCQVLGNQRLRAIDSAGELLNAGLTGAQ